MSCCWVCSALGLCGRRESRREGGREECLWPSSSFRSNPSGFMTGCEKKKKPFFRSGHAAQMSSSMSQRLADFTNEANEGTPPGETGSLVFAWQIQQRFNPSWGAVALAECDLERSFITGLTFTIHRVFLLHEKYSHDTFQPQIFKTPHPTL